MSKKVLVISGSGRINGNSDRLSNEFIRGAEEGGNDVKKFNLKDLNISGCIGCRACQKNSGICFQKDDMQLLCQEMIASDVIVFASPVYFYSWNAQTKTVVDRSYAVESILTDKTFYLLSSAAAPDESYMSTMRDSFEHYVACFRKGGNKVGGIVFGLNARNLGDLEGSEALLKAFEYGKNV